MAQTLQQQDSRESSSNSENRPLPPPTDSQQQLQSNPTTTISGTKIVTNRASRLAPTDSATTPTSIPSPSPLNESNSSHNTVTPIFNRHQPSKVFITKCRTELEALLSSIKDKYHEEIKALNSNESLHADLFVQIGEEFKKPLHKCIVASRAFKLYNALKAFELVEVPVEEDIIISEFQGRTRDTDAVLSEESAGEEKASKSRPETPEVGPITSEAISILHCHLPDNLISPELLLNFVRRVYLDQDISEEENKLYHSLIDWLKLNKPELIKTPNKQNSRDYRESFRTVQPFFDSETLLANSPSAMSADRSSNGQQVEDVDDELDKTSQGTSAKDESLTTSLTRTETFELISRNKPESPSTRVATPTKNESDVVSNDGTNEDDDNKADASSDLSNTNSPYAPTTRTGLKPKTFTTPTNLRPTPRSNLVNSAKTTPSANPKSSARDESLKTKAAQGSPTSRLSSQNKQTPTAAKRSSLSSSNQSETTPPSTTPTPKMAGLVCKLKSPPAAVGKSKLTSIARAHPISLERSQSPSTNVMNNAGSGRNFIAANKRLVSQMEKKSAQNNDTSLYDSEAENSDNYSFGCLEPLTTDNIIAQMDKFTLVSYSKLADALSRLFIDGIMSDAVIFVQGDKQINVHKCILAARSAYLAEVIDKQSNIKRPPSVELAESEQERNCDQNEQRTTSHKLKIDMTEYSYPAVYFSILHIYSGIVKVPEDIDLEELTKLTNQLHVTTLRQVCMHNLRMHYCHYFHKPCNVCCVGVLKTLPLAWRYDYTELYSKCLQWIGSNFAQIFCLKEFSELKPHDLVEECYSATLSQLTPDNVIPKTIECQKLLKNLPSTKRTESIICLVGRQLEDFCHYVADNYEKILQSESFLNLGKNCWECEVLEENLLAAMNHLKPDSGCKTLIQLHKIECSIESYGDDPRNVSDSFANLVSKMRKYCERYLLKEAASVVHCGSWRHMNPSLQKRIKDQAIITTDFDEPTKQLTAKPKLLTSSRIAGNNHQLQSTSPLQQLNNNNNNSSEGTRSPSNRSTPESRLKSPSTTYLPAPKSKMAAARHVKVLK